MRPIALILLTTGSLFAAQHYAYSGREAVRTVSAIQPQAVSAALPGHTLYLGDGFEYRVARIVTDSAGNTYAAGTRILADSSSKSSVGVGVDAFVSKIDPSGTLVFTATFSGKASEQGTAVAVDPSGNIYLAGTTSSKNFPLRNATQRTLTSSASFLLKLSSDGGTLYYSTYFGGTYSASTPAALATDASGNLYIAGGTYAGDFRPTAGLNHAVAGSNPAPGGAQNVYFAKLSPVGKTLYAGLLGGHAITCTGGSSCTMSLRQNWVTGVAVDASGSLYLTGNTGTTDLPTTPGAYVGTGGIGAFVTKVKADGTGLAYSTYLGKLYYGTDPYPVIGDLASTIAVDSQGNAFVGGTTTDPKYPVTPGSLWSNFAPAPDPNGTVAPPSDGFVSKLNPTGTALLWSTRFGGDANDTVTALALDTAGNVWIAGTTASAKFPNQNGWAPQGTEYLIEYNSTYTAMPYLGRFPANTVAQSITVEPSGTLHVAGTTGLVTRFNPAAVTAQVFGIVNSAAGDLAGVIAPSELITIRGTKLGPAKPVNYTLDEHGLVPKTLGGVTVQIGGVAAPLLSVAENEIHAIVPKGVEVGAATVSVVYSGTTAPDFATVVASDRPEIFRNSGISAAAINEDGTVNSAVHPAKVGSIVSIWATGTGASETEDGSITKTVDPDRRAFSLEINGAYVFPAYAGPAPGAVAGVSQANFVVPAIVTTGYNQMAVRIAGAAHMSEAAYIYVTQ